MKNPVDTIFSTYLLLTLTTEQNVRWAISMCCVFDQWSTPLAPKKITKLAYFIQLKLTNLMSQSLTSWNGGQVQTDSLGRLGTPSGLYASPCCAYEYFGLWVLHHNNHIYMLFWPFSPWAFYPHSRHPVLHHFHSVVGSGVSWSHWQLVHRLTLDLLRDQLKKNSTSTSPGNPPTKRRALFQN